MLCYPFIPRFLSRCARNLKSTNPYAAVVAAFLIVGGLIGLCEYRVWQSEKSIVKTFESLRRDKYSDLTLVVENIEQAGVKFRFVATLVDDSDEDSIRTLLTDEDEDFIVINYQEMPDFLGEFGNDFFDLVSRDGVYFLMRERSNNFHSRIYGPSFGNYCANRTGCRNISCQDGGLVSRA